MKPYNLPQNNMIEEIIKNDLSWEHPQHFKKQEGCSECYNEVKVISEYKNLEKPEKFEKGWAESIMKQIIWGK